MPNEIRVLMADDSAAVRHLIGDTLNRQPGITVVGTAKNGAELLTQRAAANPDVILLDVEMPVLDGIETLRKIRQTDKKTPVIMFSSLTVRGGEATLEALAIGASDYVPKPSAKNVDEAIRYIQQQLVPRIRHLIPQAAPVVRPFVKPTATAIPKPAISAKKRSAGSPIDIVAIGASTGGPNALADVVAGLPQDLKVPVVVVQHMPAIFTKLLADRLDKICPLRVREATEGTTLKAGDVWIAPGDFHLALKKDGADTVLRLHQEAAENSCRPAVDVLFRSVADIYGDRSLGVILTGMGKDGTAGAKAMYQKGAAILAQDQQSCVVWGMPRAVTEAGIVEKELPLTEIAKEISSRVRLHLRKPQLAAAN